MSKSKEVAAKNVKLGDLLAMSRKSELDKIDILSLQRLMQELIHGEEQQALDGESFHNVSKEYVYFKSCFDSENQEVLQLLPWKTWKSDEYKKMDFLDIIDYFDEKGGEIIKETADLVFFFSAMLIKLLGMMRLPANDRTIKAMYAIKFLENINRIKTGKFKMQGELTESSKKKFSEIEKILEVLSE